MPNGKKKSAKAEKTSAEPQRVVRAATAASILGRPMVPQDVELDASEVRPEWIKFYKSLMAIRERLQEQMSGLAKESAEQMDNYSLHMADSGTDNFDRDFALSLLSSDQDALYEINEALRRIEKGTYGVCELTGKNIPKDRLTAIPWARFTVEAQAQLEKDGALRQRRLGKLGSIDSTGASDFDDSDDDYKPAKERE